MHVVYILLSKKNPQRYYIGITENLAERLKEHNASKTGYAKQFAPWDIETKIEFKDRKLAYAFEKYLKSGSGNAFLKKHFLPRPGIL